MAKYTCFKAYDIRGKLGVELNNSICYRISRSFASVLNAKKVIVGMDARESSPELAKSVIKGLLDEGVNVLNLGLCGTEEVYFSTSYFNADGGLMITGSHNPINFNGIKMVAEDSKPLDKNEHINKIKELSENGFFKILKPQGELYDVALDARKAYVKKIISFVDPSKFPKLKIVVNSGNGAAGPTFDLVEQQIKLHTGNISFVKLRHEVNGMFPNGIPNPLIKQNQKVTAKAVVDHKADLGIAFDGDFDRCFFFDHNGLFISGEYIVALLAKVFLNKNPKSAIVFDSRVIFNIKDEIKNLGGFGVQSKVGHSFIKRVMRQNNAIYGGELSAHHYFRNFSYCDSGMIPWLLICELLGRTGKSLSSLIASQISLFPSSGELNFIVKDKDSILNYFIKKYETEAIRIDYMDGVSMEFDDWRFNIRPSNTENILRLNLESRGDKKMIKMLVKEITQEIKSFDKN